MCYTKMDRLEWTNKMIMDFLDLYEKEPHLWNPSHPMNKNRVEQHNTWKRIQEQMTTLGYTVTIADIKRKKDSLLASFRGCLTRNKVKNTIKSANGNEEFIKPSWFAYDKMASFLREKDPSRIPIADDVNCMKTELSSENEISLDHFEDDFTFQETDCTISSKNTYIVPTASKKRKTSSVHYSLSKKFNRKTGAGMRNELELYGELLVTKLRNLDEQSRDIAMNRIDNLLFEIKSENYKRHQIKEVLCSATTSPHSSRESSVDGQPLSS